MPVEYLLAFLGRRTIQMLLPIVGLARRNATGSEARALDYLHRRLIARAEELAAEEEEAA